MPGDRTSTHKKTRYIILNKLTVTYLYETKVLSTTRDATKMLQGRFCEQGMGEGRGGETLTDISRNKNKKSITNKHLIIIKSLSMVTPVESQKLGKEKFLQEFVILW